MADPRESRFHRGHHVLEAVCEIAAYVTVIVDIRNPAVVLSFTRELDSGLIASALSWIVTQAWSLRPLCFGRSFDRGFCLPQNYLNVSSLCSDELWNSSVRFAVSRVAKPRPLPEPPMPHDPRPWRDPFDPLTPDGEVAVARYVQRRAAYMTVQGVTGREDVRYKWAA